MLVPITGGSPVPLFLTYEAEPPSAYTRAENAGRSARHCEMTPRSPPRPEMPLRKCWPLVNSK